MHSLRWELDPDNWSILDSNGLNPMPLYNENSNPLRHVNKIEENLINSTLVNDVSTIPNTQTNYDHMHMHQNVLMLENHQMKERMAQLERTIMIQKQLIQQMMAMISDDDSNGNQKIPSQNGGSLNEHRDPPYVGSHGQDCRSQNPLMRVNVYNDPNQISGDTRAVMPNNERLRTLQTQPYIPIKIPTEANDKTKSKINQSLVNAKARQIGSSFYKKPNDNRYYAAVKILNRTFNGLIDSGAERTIGGKVLIDHVKEWGWPMEKYSGCIVTVDGTSHQPMGEMNLEVKCWSRTKNMIIILLPVIANELILGMDFWNEFQLFPTQNRDTMNLFHNCGVRIHQSKGIADKNTYVKIHTAQGISYLTKSHSSVIDLAETLCPKTLQEPNKLVLKIIHWLRKIIDRWKILF